MNTAQAIGQLENAKAAAAVGPEDPLGPQPLLEEERNRTKPAPKTFGRDKKKRRNPQAPTLCPFTRPLPHGNTPEGCSPPSYRSMSTVA